MNSYNSIKEEILLINQNISKLFKNLESLSGKSDNSFIDWQKTCNSIHKQLSEEIIRVAVVGPIKSGKSTFINSVLKGDYLKRGAGVVTSIVTRVRRGEVLNAKLLFKSWDEVNSDVEQALVLFPYVNWSTENERFDIRRKKERNDLRQALDSLDTKHLITRNSRNPNSVLLSSYLKGYDIVTTGLCFVLRVPYAQATRGHSARLADIFSIEPTDIVLAYSCKNKFVVRFQL